MANMFIFSGLRPEQQQTLAKILILALSAIVAFILRLFAVIRYESVIHEFGKILF
jgi:hypothetical protein